MAKKIRLDFSKVEERAGWKTDHMPEGLHEFKIELMDDKDAADGTEMYTYGLRPTNPKYKTRLFPYYCKQQPNQLFKLRDLHIAAGVLDPKRAKGKAVDINLEAPIGKLIAAEVVDSRNVQYQGRSEIDGVYNTDILDGVDDDAEDEVDEDEDEVDDEEYEDEEGDDEDLREEVEALTLGELRKRAKGLGIDTDGVKKVDLIELVLEEELGEEDEEDEEDDDLDDEELEDEDLDDEEFEDDEDDEEEDEPEPAPKRRAAQAKKAPAKAPAKRTVKRR